MKIGYTGDDDTVAGNRDQTYRTENPNIIHYKLIKGLSKIEETKQTEETKEYYNNINNDNNYNNDDDSDDEYKVF